MQREWQKQPEKLALREADEIYKDNSQMRIEEFVFPYGKLDPENDWVKLAALVPWDTAEEWYAAQFTDNGAPAHLCRVVLGSLLIQRRLKCSDRWLVKHIGENPYLQFFIGMKEYEPCPFGASTLEGVHQFDRQGRKGLESTKTNLAKATLLQIRVVPILGSL